MADPKEVKRLQDLAYEMRKKLLNLCGNYDGAVHIGGDLSMTDLLIGLYHHGMNVDPKDIHDPTRDRFILSKGHGAVCMYIAMSLRGYFDYDEIVRTYGKLDSAYGMHPCKIQLPGVECSSGSLGQGLAMAVGMAFSARQKKETHRVFCMMGDGETCEGEIWEAANTAGSYKLGNLIGIVDRNKQMMTSFDGDYMHLEPYAGQMASFQLERGRDRRAQHDPDRRCSRQLAAHHQQETDRDHLQHDQRQRRLLHGEEHRLACRRTEQGRYGKSHRRC